VELDPFQLLGVTHTATQAEIMSAHGRLSSVFGPERWRDAPSEVQVEAVRWTQAIDETVRVVLGTTGSTRTRAQPVA
jgi:DnaJ-class molecular chaperone